MAATSSPLRLHWLPRTSNWRERAATLPTSPEISTWASLVALANEDLDLIRTINLDRSLQLLFKRDPPQGLLTQPVRLAVLGSSSLAHLLAGVRIACLRRNIWAQTYEPDFGQFLQELCDRQSGLYDFQPTVVLLAFDAQHLVRSLPIRASDRDAEAAIQTILDSLRGYCRIAREAFQCQVLLQTVLPVFPALIGGNEHLLPGSRQRLTYRLNDRLRDMAREEGVDLIAVDVRAAADGMRHWHDPVLWHRAKQEISPAASPIYGELVARLIAARQGRSYKCLAMDLDNTLWGGVVGDDGLSGIVIGQGSALGEAFFAVQAFARDLSQRGVVLAVCSKNDEANALEPFEKHPEMLLKRSDIAAFAANWEDKARNLRFIAEQLNIGLDAIVFLDDNPVERDFVRSVLPAVAVPEVPSDPALVPQCLAEAGYFEAVTITADDLHRTELYQSNRKRVQAMGEAANLDTYLSDLDMRLEWGIFDDLSLPRIVQLINKTNQFNLTTKRYSDEDVRMFMSQPGCLGLRFRLIDKFGDNGLIGVVMGRTDSNQSMVLEAWLMSCRVIGRQVEQATLNVVVDVARALGSRKLTGLYRPTPKNGLVAGHYRTLGFVFEGELTDGTSVWTLDLEGYEPRSAPIELLEVRHG